MRDRLVNINHFLHRAGHTFTTIKEHNFSGLLVLCTTWVLQELMWEREVLLEDMPASEGVFSEESHVSEDYDPLDVINPFCALITRRCSL
jgi:hypothetical protein